MSEFFDRNGKKITIEEWSNLLEDRDYKILAHTRVDRLLVSTVWLGIDHDFANLFRDVSMPPLIFESMIFDTAGERPWVDLEMRRYRTEKEAMVGHTELVHIANTIEDLTGYQ